MCAKSSGMAPGLANVRPPSCTKFANDQPPGTDNAGKCPAVTRERSMGMTDALQAALGVSQQAELQCVTVSPH